MNTSFVNFSKAYIGLHIEKQEKSKEKNKSKEELRKNMSKGREKIFVLKVLEGKERGDVAK